MDAFSACLRNQSPSNAIELLERGRSVFWSQLTCLCSPLDDVIASGPAGNAFTDDFTHLAALTRNIRNSTNEDQHDRVCHLSLELEGVDSNIRRIPGLSQSLLPLLSPDLQRATDDGSVIVLNAMQVQLRRARHSCLQGSCSHPIDHYQGRCSRTVIEAAYTDQAREENGHGERPRHPFSGALARYCFPHCCLPLDSMSSSFGDLVMPYR